MYPSLKRILDLTGAITGGLLLLPLMAATAILIRLRLGKPVLFRQLRPGLNGKPFIFCKFRTMKELRDQRDELLPDEMRLTPLGNWLRRTSLDELPSLWNVIRGEMSLVGPRPLLMQYLPLYSERQRKRHRVKPGITGWAQINGRNAIDWPTKFELDVWYVENRSFWLDLKILFFTLIKVFRREGISARGHATVERFNGDDS